MAKVITLKELAEIVNKVAYENELADDEDQMLDFVEDLAEVLCKHFGGEVGTADYLDDKLGYSVTIRVNGEVPYNGGIWEKYDTDVTWKDGDETQR